MSDGNGSLQRDIDRLVGGDLTKAEARQLIARLDTDPVGWKQCALAYLEAQSWRRTFDAMVTREPEPVSQTVKATRTLRASGSLMATVAVVVAFVAGIITTAAWESRFGDRTSTNDLAVDAKEDSNERVKGAAKRQAESKSDEAQLVGVVNITNNGETEAAFPLVAAKGNDLVSIELSTDQLNDYNRQLWERRGYRIEQYRKLVSVALADGSRFRFPVDWVQYRYVGEQVY